MKKVYLTLAAAAFASAGFAQTSYDAITGQTFSYFTPNSTTLGEADDTTLANLNTVTSIDMGIYNSGSALTNDAMTVTIYATDPNSGLPGAVDFTQSYSVNFAAGGNLLNFVLTGGFTPTATNVWTAVTIAGGTGVIGLEIPNAAPTVGTSNDYLAWYNFQNGPTFYPGWSVWFFNGAPVANEEIRYNTGSAAPEPMSMAFLGLGAVGLIARRRNRK